jgi:glutaminase
MAMDYAGILREIGQEVRGEFGRGKVASYIPALAQVPASKLGIAVCTLDGQEHELGESREPFSIQSISKVFTLMLAMKHVGQEYLWRRVGREPSGSAFNSLVQLETERGIPRNPFINAGAIVVTDCIVAHDTSALRSVLGLARRLSGNADVQYDREVARSERETGHRNRAIAHFLKAHRNLESDPEAVLNVYFHQCAIAMSCLDLARAFLPLANAGVVPHTGERVLGRMRTRRLNSLMLTCGLYDNVGNFAFRVGFPAKSGVGGGIAAVIPRHLSICVWSPELDPAGNSWVGGKALESFSWKTGLSVF